MQEYYKVLNLDESATDEQVEIAYNELKAKYSKERFYEGEAGNYAAKMLTKVETAYQEIKASRAKTVADDKEKNDYSQVESLIRSGNINQAQQLLDDYYDRDAEWHYLQSVIFIKRTG